tara:strand:+ start:959 stop:1114 length:156 start_codon:yes stop_codon:yes gene_type:complete
MTDDFIENEFWSLINEEYGDTQIINMEQVYEVISPYPGIFIVVMEDYGKET